MTYLENALKDGHAQLSGEGDAKQITYLAMNHTEKCGDPGEKVRAEYWAELIYRYGYEPKRIGFEVIVPNQTWRADLVIFHDDARTRPYAVIEFKTRWPSPTAEFDLEQLSEACRPRRMAQVSVQTLLEWVAGQTRRFLDFSDRDTAFA